MSIIEPWLRKLFRESHITRQALLSDQEIDSLAAKVLGRTEVQDRYKSHYMRAGSLLSAHRGSGMEFVENRLYAHGDNPRAIHWRLSARLNKLHSKVMTEDKETQWLIVSDRRPAMWFGTRTRLKVKQMAIANCLAVFSALASGRTVANLLLEEKLEVKPFQRGLAIGKMMAQDICAPRKKNQENFACATPMTLEDALRAVAALSSPGSSIFISSDFSDLNEGAIKQLARLAVANLVIAVQIYDPAELTLPRAGVINAINPTTQMASAFDTNHATIRSAYHRLANKSMEYSRTNLQRVCTHYVSLPVTDDAFTALARIL